MREFSMRWYRRIRALVRDPDFYVVGAVLLFVLFQVLRPTAVADDDIADLALSVDGITQRPAYAFHPGASFFSPNGEPHPDGEYAVAMASGDEVAGFSTYDTDLGPGFFDLISDAPLSDTGTGSGDGAGSSGTAVFDTDTGPGFFDLVGDAPLPDPAESPPEQEQVADLTVYDKDTGPSFFELIGDGPIPVAGPDADKVAAVLGTVNEHQGRDVDQLATLSEDGVLTIRAEDFGAVMDPAVDNRAAIQAAIDYAHVLGGGVVLLGDGVYGIAGEPGRNGALKLRSNTFLQGVGMGRSVLRLVDGWSGKLVGIVRTPWGVPTVNYGIADLTLDGNRAATSGKVDAYYSGGLPGGTVADEDAWILRVEARDCSGYGFDPHERTIRLTISDSVARNNGKDGFVADYVIDGVYRRNLSVGNGRHGFNIVTTTNDFVLEDSVAIGNGSSGLVIQRGNQPIPSPHNLQIGPLLLADNDREGALVRLSHDVDLRQVTAIRNGTYGIRVMASRNITIRDSHILNNSRQSRSRFAAVQIRGEMDDATESVIRSENVVVRDNMIGWDNPIKQRSAIEELRGEVTDTVISGNRFRGFFRRTIKVGARSTVSRNFRYEVDRYSAAIMGLFGVETPHETYGCSTSDALADGCDFPLAMDSGASR